MTEERAQSSVDGDESQPNIVLVTADSVRADHCGFLNPEMNTTPTLDGLAEEGLVFESAIAPGPRTPSSVPVIWTGEHVGLENRDVYTSRGEKKRNWQERRQRIRRHLDRFDTIAERMQRYGYDTGAVTANPWTSTDTGFDQGFDRFVEVDRLPDDGSTSLGKRLVSKASVLPRVPDADRWLLTWTDFYDEVRAVRDTLSEPYFLWVFLLDAHQPYITPPEFRAETTGPGMLYANAWYNYRFTPFEELPDNLERRFRGAYRDTVRSVDGFVEQLLGDLSADDPAFVFHSDHGEAMKEHGTRGHRPELYDENLRVPLLVHGVEDSGRVPEQSCLRLLPRFLEGIARGSTNTDTLKEDSIVVETEERERVALRTNEWKRIDSSEEWNFAWKTPTDELYNLASDPLETTNLFESNRNVSKLCDLLTDRHDQWLNERRRISDSSRGW